MDKLPQQTVVELLISQKKKISFAESCTGGLLSKKITDVSGASEVFDCGFVTYSNEKKTELLGVKTKTLCDFGAVSYQTALEMAEGVRKKSGADIGVSVTGIAGPGGGTAEKPVGLVYVGFSAEDIWAYTKLMLSGDRDEVREKTSLAVYDIIKLYLTDKLKTSGSCLEYNFAE